MNRLQVAQRANVPPFHVMDLLAAATERQRTHGDLCNLVAGQPSTGAPRAVREEAKRLLDQELLGYTVATGIRELREAIGAHHRRRSGIEVDADDVVVTTGSSGGFLLAFLSAFEAGDRVVMANPGYPCYRNVLTALGCEVVEVDCGPETRFQPTLAQLQAVEGPVAGVLIASPANPTGTMIDPAELASIARWCEQTGVRLISDEIYHGIQYGDAAVASAWQTSRTGIVFGSFSKYFSMTGWRMGWMLVPEELRRPVDVLTGNFTICPPALGQYAALAAFTPESYAELDGHVARYAGNRGLLLEGLAGLGLDRLAPADGAFYCYADVGELTHDAYAWCLRLLAETGVAMAPGIDFDTRAGSRFVRMSFAGSAAEITEALERLGRWL
ncbi:pyridoxal phosphate-dependent aminotransferase [Nocardioides terrisoli]|uniref:pyridoxal phosphate-dependent aminotransferase n=1 Tax=Nocardioides terrisoli TaxID=3388267 RepID=UPI00287B99DE|nr:pyridoxal phosphate-dependent aminotransferase [Nocardioides marmorisolisilvae]